MAISTGEMGDMGDIRDRIFPFAALMNGQTKTICY